MNIGRLTLVPTLCVGMYSRMLRVQFKPSSVESRLASVSSQLLIPHHLFAFRTIRRCSGPIKSISQPKLISIQGMTLSTDGT